MTQRLTMLGWLAASLLLAAAGGLAQATAEAQGGASDGTVGAALESAWFSRHLDPLGDAAFLALEVDDARRNDLWLLARRYQGARGEGEAFHELWRFEAGERRRVYPLSAEQVAANSRFAALRRLDDGGVAVGFLSPDAEAVVLVLDPGASALRASAGSAALKQLTPVSALALHSDGDVTVAAGQGLVTVARLDPHGGTRWRHVFGGSAGELAEVSELAILGGDVVALGVRTPAAADGRGEVEAALTLLGADGQPRSTAALPEWPARSVASPAGEVAVAMGRFQPGVAVPVATFAAVVGPEPDVSVPVLARKSTAETLPTEQRRNWRLAVARVCGNLYAYADEEPAAGHDGEHIRLALVGENGEVEKILTGAGPEDLMIIDTISLIPSGETLYVAVTIVQVLETREIRSGIDVYKLDLGSVCGR